MPPAATTNFSFLLMKTGCDECFVTPSISYALMNAEDEGSPPAFAIDRHFADSDVEIVDKMVPRVVGKPIKGWTSSEDGR